MLFRSQDLKKYWYSNLTNIEDLFITDGKSAFGEPFTPKGQYRFFAKAGGDRYGKVSTDLSPIGEDWTLEFSAKMVSLPTLDALTYAAWRGLSIEVFTGTKRYIIGFTDGIIGVHGSAENYIRVPLPKLGNDIQFYTWKISFSNETSTLIVFKDDIEIAHFTKVKGLDVSPKSGLAFNATPLETIATSKPLDVYVEGIKLTDKAIYTLSDKVDGQLIEVNTPRFIGIEPFDISVTVGFNDSFFQKLSSIIGKFRGVQEKEPWSDLWVDVSLSVSDGSAGVVKGPFPLVGLSTPITIDGSGLKEGSYRMAITLLSKISDGFWVRLDDKEISFKDRKSVV